MGELQHEAFQFTFNGFLKVAFQGSRVTSDAGLILVRELDEHLGLETLICEHLSDSRQGLNTQFSLADLLRQSVYSRLAGYEDLNDAVRVSADPTFRLNKDTYTEIVRHLLANLWNRTRKDDDCSEWREVNELKDLFRLAQPWTRQEANEFLQAAWDCIGDQ